MVLPMQIEFAKVRKEFFAKPQKILAVDNASWQAEGGHIYGVLGPNGSGKTTMIRLLVNLLYPDSGEVLVDGDISGNASPAFRQQLGYLPEERGVYKKLRALSFLTFLGQLKGLSRADAKRRSDELLERANLSSSKENLIGGFSRGMSQRLQFISAILHSPSLLILDEPFANLDPVSVRFIRELITEQKNAGALVLLCTHRMSEAEQLCDRIFMVRKGKVLVQGDLQEIRREHGEQEIFVESLTERERYETVERMITVGSRKKVELREGASVSGFLREVVRFGGSFDELHIEPPSLEDIYIKLVEDEGH